jgi:hypothetical protein
MLGRPNPYRQPNAEPHGGHWRATHSFVDVRLSHIIEGFLGIALLSAAVAQIFVYLGQAKLMSEANNLTQQAVAAANRAAEASTKQANIAEDTERRQLRAYVGIIPGDIENLADVSKRSYAITYKNFGLTPAYNVALGFVDSDIFHEYGSIPRNIPIGKCAAPAISGLMTLFPTMQHTYSVTGGRKYSADQIAPVMSGSENFIYYGTLCYHDAWQIPHYTNFCWRYKGEALTGKDAISCVQLNDSN